MLAKERRVGEEVWGEGHRRQCFGWIDSMVFGRFHIKMNLILTHFLIYFLQEMVWQEVVQSIHLILVLFHINIMDFQG